MARYTYAGTTDDLVFVRTRGGLMKTVAATLTFYDAATGGTQHTDLLLDGAPVTEIPVADDGQVPEFTGPDGVDEMWVQVAADVDTPAGRSLLRARAAGADPAGTAQTLVDQLKAGAPTTLDDLDELAAALGDDPGFASTVLGSLAGKLATAELDTETAALMQQPGSAVRTVQDAAFAKSGLPAVAVAAGATSRFDPTQTLYNATPSSLRKWRQALARQANGGGAAVIGCYGGSITEGYLATPAMSSGAWPIRLQNKLDARYGDAGEGLYHWSNRDSGKILMNGASFIEGFGFFGKSCWNINAISNTTKYVGVGPVVCDSFRIYYVRNSGTADIKYDLDNAGTWAGSFVTKDAGLSGNDWGTTVVSAGALGSHTIKCTPASGNMYIVGIEPIVGTKGVRAHRLGRGGLKASTMWTTTNLGQGGSIDFLFDAVAPDLSVLWLGHNEYLQNESVATFKTNMQLLIDKAQETGDVLLLTQVPNADLDNVPSQADYDTAVYELADANDCVVLDMGARWESRNASLPFYGDVTHPNDLGYSDIANAVFDAVASGA